MTHNKSLFVVRFETIIHSIDPSCKRISFYQCDRVFFFVSECVSTFTGVKRNRYVVVELPMMGSFIFVYLFFQVVNVSCRTKYIQVRVGPFVGGSIDCGKLSVCPKE